MKDWNLIVTTYQQGFRRALRALQDIGPTDRTAYYNVLAMKVDDPLSVLAFIECLTEETPALYDTISRVGPAMRVFDFQSAQDFKDKGSALIMEWTPKLCGQSFHVRLHRRGPILDLRTPDGERFFDEVVIAATSGAGMPARMSFSDPDVLIVVDTIDERAGLSIWTREELADHRLLRPD